MIQILIRLATVSGAVLLLSWGAMAPAPASEAITILATGDTTGHVGPCRSCAVSQLGGLARRSALVHEQRAAGAVLLVDAGNALFGRESLASEGRVIVAGYNAIGYDVVNLSYRDFRLGKAATLAALDTAEFAAVSANLYHAGDPGRRLVAPFIVHEQGGKRWAIVGLSDRPAGLESLSHLTDQLAGIEVRSPAEALAEVLPQASAAADAVILVYYGSAASTRALLDELDELAGSTDAGSGQLHAMVAGGDEVGSDTPAGIPPIGWTAQHGTHVTRWRLPAQQGPASHIERLAVLPTIEADSDLATTLQPMMDSKSDAGALDSDGASSDPVATPERLPATVDALELDRRYPLLAQAENRALKLHVDAATLHEQYQGKAAPDGYRWLVLEAAIENQMPIDLVFDLDYQERILIASLPRQLFLLINGTHVQRLTPQGADHLSAEFILPYAGATAVGKLVFAVPAQGLTSLSVRYYHDEYAPLILPLLGDGAGTETAAGSADAMTETQTNDFMALAVQSAERHEQWAGQAAPAGMQWLVVDLRGRGMLSIEADARAAVSEDAPVDEKIDLPKVMEYVKATQLLQAVVDGEHGYVREWDKGTLLRDPALLPDAWAGGQAVFAVPADAEAIELVCYFPEFKAPGASASGIPKPFRFTLVGDPTEPDPVTPLAVIEDDPTPLTIVGAQVTGRFSHYAAEAGRKLVVLDAAMHNNSDVAGLMNISGRLSLHSDVDGPGELIAATIRGGVPLSEPMLLPAGGERRRFSLIISVPVAAGSVTMRYGGVSVARSLAFNLPSSGSATATKALPGEEPTDLGAEASGFESLTHAEERHEESTEKASGDNTQAADSSGGDGGRTAESDPGAKPTADPSAAPSEAQVAADDDDDESEPSGPGPVFTANDAETATTAGLRVAVVASEDADAWLRAKNRTAVNLARHSFGAVMTLGEGLRSRNVTHFHNGRLDMNNQMHPGEYELQLAGGRPVPIHQLAMAFNALHVESRFRIDAADGSGGYRHLATIGGVDHPQWHLQVLTFDPVVTDRIRITRYGEPERRRSHRTRVPEIMVFEGPLATKADSVLSQGGTNISRMTHGGTLFRVGQRLGGNAGHLITSSHEKRYRATIRTSRPDAWLGPFIVAFQANREALIEAIELWPANDEHRDDRLPGRIRISAARDEPFAGDTLIGEYDVSTVSGRPWRIDLEKPTRARFLKVELAPAEGQRSIAVGEIAVYEGTQPGYESVLIRGDGVDWRNRQQPSLAELIGDAAGEVQQIPADASMASPVDMGQDTWLGNTLEDPDEQHVYRLTLDHEPGQIPELTLHMTPFLRGQVRIRDAQGHVLETFDAGAGASTTLHRVLPYEPGNYLVEVNAAPIYLFLGFDASGSMGAALDITPAVLSELTQDLPAGVHVALGSSHGRGGKSFTLYSGYSRDATALAHAVTDKQVDDKRMFQTGGGSDWYNLMRDMMAWADANMPPHAVGATVLVADGVGSGDYDGLWARLQATRQRLYSVAWGNATLRLDAVDHGTGWTASRGLFNAAWYRHGRYFEPQTDAALIDTYHDIIDDVTTPAEYALQFTVRDRESGYLQTSAPEGPGRPTLFVLDASGSMMATVGEQTRLDVALEVMEEVITGLSQGTPVGLRVYGHRFRAFGDERARAATDSQLLIPIGPLDHSAFMSTLQGISARGATPLAYTMEQVAEDLDGFERPRVVVLTDGVDSFRRDPVAKTGELVEQFPHMELAVVGFQISEEMERDNLRGMAEAGRGVYYHATDGASLVQSVDSALNLTVPYTLHAADGAQVATGVFGDGHDLPEGVYELRASIDGGQARLPLRIPGERTLHIGPDDLPLEPAPDDSANGAETGAAEQSPDGPATD